jgi:hypothetical protein
MRSHSAALLASLAATSLSAQQIDTTFRSSRILLDSSTVVRFHWRNGSEKARLLAPLGPASSEARYCRYPAPSCGSDLNPARARSLSDLNRLDIRQGSRAGRGALVGGAAGLAGSLLLILGQSLSDGPKQDDIPRAFFVGMITVVWTGLGALIGASLDNWKAVPQ